MNSQPMSRRERQIMDLLHQLGSASANDVRSSLPDPPSYSAVRAHLRVMEEKGLVTHVESGRTYVYRPSSSPKQARRAAVRHLVATFFGGSVEDAAAALLELPDSGLDVGTRERIARRIARARAEGR